MRANRSEAVIAANGKVPNRYLLCSIAGRAARTFQISGKLSSQAITEAFHLLGKGEPIGSNATRRAFPLAA